MVDSMRGRWGGGGGGGSTWFASISASRNVEKEISSNQLGKNAF